jgi:hypothetical protein
MTNLEKELQYEFRKDLLYELVWRSRRISIMNSSAGREGYRL